MVLVLSSADSVYRGCCGLTGISKDRAQKWATLVANKRSCVFCVQRKPRQAVMRVTRTQQANAE